MKKLIYIAFLLFLNSCKTDGTYEIKNEKKVNFIFTTDLSFESANFSLDNFKKLINIIKEDDIYHAPEITFYNSLNVKSKKSKLFQIPLSGHSKLTKSVGTYGVSEFKSDYDNFILAFNTKSKYIKFINNKKARSFSREELDSVVVQEKIDLVFFLDGTKTDILHKDKEFVNFKDFYLKYSKLLVSANKNKINVLFTKIKESKKTEITISAKPKEIPPNESPKKIPKKPKEAEKKKFSNTVLKFNRVDENTNTIYWSGIADVKEYIIEIHDSKGGFIVVNKQNVQVDADSFSPGAIASSMSSKPLKGSLTAIMKDGSRKTIDLGIFEFKQCK
jgi:hypothetical protein